MSKKSFTPGTRVMLNDGRAGTVIPCHLVPLDSRMRPLVPGNHGPVDWGRQIAVRLDGGGVVVKFKNEVEGVMLICRVVDDAGVDRTRIAKIGKQFFVYKFDESNYQCRSMSGKWISHGHSDRSIANVGTAYNSERMARMILAKEEKFWNGNIIDY